GHRVEKAAQGSPGVGIVCPRAERLERNLHAGRLQLGGEQPCNPGDLAGLGIADDEDTGHGVPRSQRRCGNFVQSHARPIAGPEAVVSGLGETGNVRLVRERYYSACTATGTRAMISAYTSQ